MKLNDLKKIAGENFEDEFKKYVVDIKPKEEFYNIRHFKLMLGITIPFLIIIIILGILADGINPVSLLIEVLFPDDIFKLSLYILIIYYAVTPVISLDFKEKKLQNRLKKINFTDIESIKLKSSFNLEINYEKKKVAIDIAAIKDIERLILILKKEFGEKFII